jgi:integrase
LAQYSRKLKIGLRWFYKFNFLGVTYRSKCIFLSKTEAKQAEHYKYEEVANQARNPYQKPFLSLLGAINERLDYVEVKKSKDYFKDNKRYYTILLNKLGDIPFIDVKKAQIEDLLLATSKKQQSRGLDNYTVNAMINTYKALFNYIIDKHDLNIKNPCKGIDKFSIKKKFKYIPSDSDIDAVKSLCDDGQAMLINFVKDTGCRISEALRITGKEILQACVVLYTKKSRNSDLVPRKVPKPVYIKKIIVETDERLFNRWCDVPRFLEDKVRELEQQNWNWHNLRHRFASKLSKEGKPLFEIMSLLGHSNLKTTQNYLQLLP